MPSAAASSSTPCSARPAASSAGTVPAAEPVYRVCQDCLKDAHPWRERKAVALDRLAQQLGEDRLVVVAQIRRHCGIMRRKRSDGESAPMTLSQALAAKVRLIVWCKSCGHRAEPAVVDQVARYGGDTTVIDWARRLRCSACGRAGSGFRRQRCRQIAPN